MATGAARAHREVARLLEAGILVERSVGRTRLIRANPDGPLTSPLREILVVSAGPAALLTEELGRVAGVESAFLYGSFAARLLGVEGAAPDDIDVMVIGTLDAGEVYEVCARVEAVVHRPINPTMLTAAELAQQSGFLDSVRAGPIVSVVGGPPWL